MLDVFCPNRLEARRIHDVVIAVGQRQPSLVNLGNLLCRILLVLADTKVEETVGSALVFQLAQQCGQLFGVRNMCDLSPGRLDRRQSLLLHRGRIHAGRIKVPILLLQRSLRVLRGGVQFLPEQIAVPFAQE